MDILKEQGIAKVIGSFIGSIGMIFVSSLLLKIVWNDILFAIIPTLPILTYWESFFVFVLLRQIIKRG